MNTGQMIEIVPTHTLWTRVGFCNGKASSPRMWAVLLETQNRCASHGLGWSARSLPSYHWPSVSGPGILPHRSLLSLQLENNSVSKSLSFQQNGKPLTLSPLFGPNLLFTCYLFEDFFTPLSDSFLAGSAASVFSRLG